MGTIMNYTALKHWYVAVIIHLLFHLTNMIFRLIHIYILYYYVFFEESKPWDARRCSHVRCLFTVEGLGRRRWLMRLNNVIFSCFWASACLIKVRNSIGKGRRQRWHAMNWGIQENNKISWISHFGAPVKGTTSIVFGVRNGFIQPPLRMHRGTCISGTSVCGLVHLTAPL